MTIEQQSGTIPRRQVVRGAAWAVPVVAVAAAAPRAAASPCASEPCLTTAVTNFGTSSSATNGWSLTTTGSFYGSSSGNPQAVGWYPGPFTYAGAQTSYRAGTTIQCTPAFTSTNNPVTLTGPVVVAQGDPQQSGSTISWGKTFCLVGGRTYTFTYNWIRYGVNGLAAYQYTYITPGEAPVGGAGTLLGSVNAAPVRSNNASGTTSVAYTPTAGGLYTFYFHWTFDQATSYPVSTRPDCGTYANDFAVNAPIVTCTG